jgi:hypothetical protein
MARFWLPSENNFLVLLHSDLQPAKLAWLGMLPQRYHQTVPYCTSPLP